jgi:drug/metabolite transporter (DMT)-like permease
MKGSISSKQYAWITAGLLFACLWGSASTATKIGLRSAQPLVIAIVRFGIAAIIMLLFAHVIRRKRLPSGKEWGWLTIYGILNITIYLGLYVIGMQEVTAGIGALAVAANPVFISFLSVFFLKKKLTASVIIAIIICMGGVVCAAWPLLGDAAVTTKGLLIILFSMLSYSIAAIYFSRKNWNGLSLFAINGWQTGIGGLLLVPFVLYYYNHLLNHFNQTFWGATLWLAIPVSIFAVQLWLWLLQKDAIKAGLWLFLCPLFGFSIAAVMVKDTISGYTIAGTLLVLLGLFLSQRNIKKE